MDATKTLDEMLELAAGIRNDMEKCDGGMLPKPLLEGIDHLCDVVEALDQWMTSGGFPPDTWQGKVLSGYMDICCHNVRWWYRLGDVELKRNLKAELQTNARLDALENIQNGTRSGELEYWLDELDGDIKGGWAIV